jgi:hypothetical protein
VPPPGERSSAVSTGVRALGHGKQHAEPTGCGGLSSVRQGVDSPKGAGGIQQAVREERDLSRWLPTSSPTKWTMSSVG